MSKMAQRYIELTYKLPGDDTTHFRAVIIHESNSPGDCLRQAQANLLHDHPNAIDPEEFMQRLLTEEQARTITAKMEDGTWEGWKFT